MIGAAVMMTVAIANPTAVPANQLARAERAVAWQADVQLRAAWHTPRIRFVPGETADLVVRFDVTRAELSVDCGDDAGGCHWPGRIAVGTWQARGVPAWYKLDWWTDMLSHEVTESLVDPDGRGDEPCDPVSEYDYRHDGVDLSDFVWPGYFDGGYGQLDQMGLVRRAPTEYGRPMPSW